MSKGSIDAALAQATRIGVLGGTFNPVHFGHLVMAENALEQLGLDRVLFVPAGDPPHKPSDGIVDAEDRLRMVELAIAGRPGFVTSRIDIDHDGPSYTWKLLERLQELTSAKLWFIIGGDSLVDFPTWVRPARILELARIAVIERPGHTLTVPDSPALPGLGDRLDVIETPLCSVSSTAIRERVGTGRSIRYLLPEAVREYIEQHGLYRARASLDTPTS